jgi:hypothetical protein
VISWKTRQYSKVGYNRYGSDDKNNSENKGIVAISLEPIYPDIYQFLTPLFKYSRVIHLVSMSLIA